MDQDPNISKIEEYFKVPDRVADKIKNIVEKVKGGYILIETRSRWDNLSGPWTRHGVAKIIFHKPSGKWRVYWHRASGAWNLYNQYKALNGALKAIDQDKYGCFWG
jgi:hypothetical protein